MKNHPSSILLVAVDLQHVYIGIFCLKGNDFDPGRLTSLFWGFFQNSDSGYNV